MGTLFYATMKSSIGSLTLVASDEGLFYVFLPVKGRGVTETLLRKKLPGIRFVKDEIRLKKPMQQLREYFEGKRTAFSVALDLRGTAFQKKVWTALASVQYGGIDSYGGIARKIRKPGAARAVGAACGANPVPIIIPCHRIVGKDGSLTGFAGGLGIKRRLLELEKRKRQ
jgi:O-6-methylguanine DNA methyltransferase